MVMPANTNYQRWFVLIIIVSATAAGLMGFAAVFPLMNLWVRDLHISRTQAGALSGLWYLPGLLVALPAGWLFDRYRPPQVLRACWIFIMAGITIMALAPNFGVLCAGRLVFSIGMNAHLVGAPKLVSCWFEGRKELGFAMGLYAMSAPIGIFASLNALGRIGSAHGWRPAMCLLVGVLAVALALLFLLRSESSPSGQPAAASRMGLEPFQFGWPVWLLAVGYFGYCIGTEAYLTFTTDYLVQRGYGLATASAMVGNYAYASFILKPVFSAFLKRKNAAVFVSLASVLAILSIALLFDASISPNIPSLILGVSLALGMPALYALPAFLVGSQKSGHVYGLLQLFYSLGFFAQPLVGYAVDKSGRYSMGYTVIVADCLLGLMCMLPLVFRTFVSATESSSGG